ncbi:protein FAM217B isoform X1 [Anolis carolinensis]|uniref:protein FAM217B isoform X1 n=1 Tax=Anolis carolinensis TaxID=28377 RepID=UPI002F2B24F4
MGPGIRDYPSLLRRGSLEESASIHEIHKGKGTVTGEKSHPSATELKNDPNPNELRTSPPQARSSFNRLSKNVSAPSKKSSCLAPDHKQIPFHCKEKSQLCEGHQESRTRDDCTSSYGARQIKKDAVVRKHYEARESKIPSPFKDKTWSDSSKAEDMLMPSFYCKEKGHLGQLSGGLPDEPDPCSPVRPGPSADAMFLDFGSVRMMKEDSDGDSASDLSDSERIPIPPSPCTPPELNLRAEEIDPLHFEHLFDAKSKRLDYYYPDFLPPPYNTWDLKDLSLFVNTECKSEPKVPAVGFLDKYIDRLLELEWLQIQTVQAEQGKASKSRPQTAPGMLRTLKSPGKIKSLHSPSRNKQLVPHESLSRLPISHSVPRRDPHAERTSQFFPYEGHSRGATSSSLAHQRRSGEVKSEAKKRPTTKQQHLPRHPSDTSSMIQGAGNMRPLKTSPSFHSPTVPLKGQAAHVPANPKKNGNVNSYLPSKKASADKKLKTNGVKQTQFK